ncbi:MAG: peptide/nickel transport system ATP-binding protein, partial [Natronomonas sp.]
DIDLVRRFCDRVAVMYLGEIVERGPTETVVGDPSHPYTRTLVASIPSLDPAIPAADAGVDLLTDDLPDATDVPSGCRFHPRCPAIIPPESVDLPRDHWQGVVAFRFRLEREWDDADELRASILREVPPAERSDTDIGTAVRAAFGLPEELADADVEAAVEAAVKAIESGDLDAARRPLAETTTSVCERESPAVVEVETAHPVSCHRYDPSVPGDPETGIETRPSEE